MNRIKTERRGLDGGLNVDHGAVLPQSHETFVPLGGGKGRGVCNCASCVAGRDVFLPDVSPTSMIFTELHRNANSLTVWVDNCSGQNKNWTFLTALQDMVNRTDVVVNTITVKYLKKGHTSMSVDSAHQVVNKFLAKALVEECSDVKFEVCVRTCQTCLESDG